MKWKRRHMAIRQIVTKEHLKKTRATKHIGIIPVVPLFLLLVVAAVAIFAPYLAPHSPLDGSLSDRLLPPSWTAGGASSHLLGTDMFGRDVLSRIIYGARVSLIISSISVLVCGTIGTVVGILSGYLGTWVDSLLMRLVDITLSLPGILIAIILAVVLGPSFFNVILVISLVFWAPFARQIRGEVLSIKQQDFVALARVAGVSPITIMRRHIFPNVVPTIIVLCTLNIGTVIIFESSLSFFGVGIPPPQPSWGIMVSDGRALFPNAWWISTFAGGAILLTVLSFNLLGDWVRDRLDPKLRQM
jgi:peptide/nickel transport system permease protein